LQERHRRELGGGDAERLQRALQRQSISVLGPTELIAEG
jgi:hypothetical protein